MENKVNINLLILFFTLTLLWVPTVAQSEEVTFDLTHTNTLAQSPHSPEIGFHAHVICLHKQCGNSSCQSAKTFKIVIRKPLHGLPNSFYTVNDGENSQEIHPDFFSRVKEAMYFQSITCSDELPIADPTALSAQINNTLSDSSNACCESTPNLLSWAYQRRWHGMNSARASLNEGWNLLQNMRADNAMHGWKNAALSMIPVAWGIISGTMGRIFHSSPAELEQELSAARATQLTDWDLEEEAKIPVLEYLKRVKNRIRSLPDGSQLDPSSNERHKVMRKQKVVLQEIFDEVEKHLSDFAVSKAAEKADPKNSTVNQLFDPERLKKLGSVTLADIRSDPEQLKRCLTLARALAITSEFIPIPIAETKATCDGELSTRPLEYRQKLEGLIGQMVTKPETSQDFVNYFYGEPGNGKTSGIITAAVCAKIPLCIIDSGVLLEAWNKRGKRDIQGMLKDLVGGCLTGIDAQGQVLSSSFSKSLESYYPGSAHRPKRAANGWILFDDVDQFLKEAFKDGSTEAKEERREFAQFFKLYADHNNPSFIDPFTKMPLFVGGLKFFKTANSPFDELNPRSEVYFAAAKDRYQTYFVPYPNPNDRRLILNYWKNQLYSRYEMLGGQSGVLDRSSCDQKYEELLEFDIKRYEYSGKVLGVRGLVCLNTAFEGYIDANAKKAVEDGKTVGQACQDLPDRSFNVKEMGEGCDDYKRTATTALEEEKFQKELVRLIFKNSENIEKIPNQKVKSFIQLRLNSLKKFDSKITLSAKEQSLLQIQKDIDFNTNRFDFSEKSALAEIRDRFQRKFGYLKTSSGTWTPEGVSIGIIGNRIIQKISDPKKIPNQMILVQATGKGASTEDTAEGLATSLGLPFCKIDKVSDLVETVYASWKVFSSLKKENYLSLSVKGHGQINSYDYDDKFNAYIYKYNGIGETTIYFAKKVDDNINEKLDFESSLDKMFKLEYDEHNNYYIASTNLKNFSEIKDATDIHRWLEVCTKKWANKGSQGVVYVSIPGQAPEQTFEMVQKVHQLILGQTYLTPEGGMADISGMTLIYESTSQRQVERLLEKDRSLSFDKQNYLSLLVDPVPIESRKEYARIFLSNGLDQFGPLQKEKFLSFYQETLQEIIQLDQEYVKKQEGQAPLSLLGVAINEIIVKDAKSRTEDALQMFSDSDAPNPVAIVEAMKAFYREKK